MYDLELKKMVEEFDFKTFLNPPQDIKGLWGAWVIITDDQYVVGYNDYDKLGYHWDSLRRAFCEILEEDKYSHAVTPSVVKKNYILGTMMSGLDSLYILFELDSLESITPKQYQLFEKFKNDYNDIIQEKANELGKSIVIFTKEGKEYASRNLDMLTIALAKKVNEKKQMPNDFHIIGKTLDNNINYMNVR